EVDHPHREYGKKNVHGHEFKQRRRVTGLARQGKLGGSISINNDHPGAQARLVAISINRRV
ncbi:unnamed protein product, partial [Amoebophrya sp. A25]